MHKVTSSHLRFDSAMGRRLDLETSRGPVQPELSYGPIMLAVILYTSPTTDVGHLHSDTAAIARTVVGLTG